MFESLDQLLLHQSPGLVCVTHTLIRKSPELIIPIEHVVTPPLHDNALTELMAEVGNVPELVEFYRRFGCATLYQSRREYPAIGGKPAAYYIAPPSEWGRIKHDVEDWFAMLDDKELQEILPEWAEKYVAVAEVPNSATYFLVALAGPDRGKVFEFSHDGFEFIESGETFAEFIAKLAQTDDKHMERIGGDTRYYDGKTSRQWMPRRYLCNGRV